MLDTRINRVLIEGNPVTQNITRGPRDLTRRSNSMHCPLNIFNLYLKPILTISAYRSFIFIQRL